MVEESVLIIADETYNNDIIKTITYLKHKNNLK